MRKVIIFISIVLCQVAAWAQGTPQERYIQKWAPTAVREMYRSGVPASITLAQGILESRYGLSPLASEGNNHFGIKCHKDWKGKSMRYDDDAKGECFRVYDSADESFQDHSDFLRYRDRYKFLFDLKTTDYKGWAYGLKKAGYATDPNYPAKLIKYIEDYKLYEYDTMTSEESERLAEAVEKGEVDCGIAMCGTGDGMAMTLNKHRGIRAGLAWGTEIARLVKAHNNANVLVMPARFVSYRMIQMMTMTWLETGFEGGRHQRRIDKIPVQ